MENNGVAELPEFDLLGDFDSFKEEMASFKLPHYNELPDVGLYMDQVVTIIERYFAVFNDGDRWTITASMINNYVKMGIIEPPVKKRYSRDQVAKLMMLTMLKYVLSMNEIRVLIRCDDGDIKTMYDDFCTTQARIFSDMDISDEGSAIELCMMALITKLYAQKLVSIQIDAIKQKTAVLSGENE